MAPPRLSLQNDRVGHQGGGGGGGTWAQIGDGAENYDVNREPPCGGEKEEKTNNGGSDYKKIRTDSCDRVVGKIKCQYSERSSVV